MSVKQVIVTTSVSACLLVGGLTAFAQTKPSTAPMPTVPPSQNISIPVLERHSCPVNAVMPVSPAAIRAALWPLKLKIEEQTKLLGIVSASDKKIRELNTSSNANRNIVDALKTVPFDRAKVEQAAAETMKLEQDIVNARIDMWTSFMQMLTPDQQKAFWDKLNSQGSRQQLIQPPAPVSTQPSVPAKK